MQLMRNMTHSGRRLQGENKLQPQMGSAPAVVAPPVIPKAANSEDIVLLRQLLHEVHGIREDVRDVQDGLSEVKQTLGAVERQLKEVVRASAATLETSSRLHLSKMHGDSYRGAFNADSLKELLKACNLEAADGLRVWERCQLSGTAQKLLRKLEADQKVG